MWETIKTILAWLGGIALVVAGYLVGRGLHGPGSPSGVATDTRDGARRIREDLDRAGDDATEATEDVDAAIGDNRAAGDNADAALSDNIEAERHNRDVSEIIRRIRERGAGSGDESTP